ncbi:MAG: hypothetical protein KAW09_11290 [Thermoplasmata archaeon]|nr:hypothetical protein [Thermoplasmata archaeon]
MEDSMDKPDVEECSDKGKMMYATPSSGAGRVFSALFVLGLCVFLAIYVIGGLFYHGATGNMKVEGNYLERWILSLFFATFGTGLVFIFPLDFANKILRPSFRIYQKGVTKQLTGFKVFRKEGEFVSFDQMTSFEYSPDFEHCIISLESADALDYEDVREEVIRTLVDTLMGQGIEMSSWSMFNYAMYG